jgi:hypothetical protein
VQQVALQACHRGAHETLLTAALSVRPASVSKFA